MNNKEASSPRPTVARRNGVTKSPRVTSHDSFPGSSFHSSTMLFTILCLLIMVPLSWSCSCLNSHPQEHFCTSDFVSLVEVKKVWSETKSSTTYSIEVKKEFKTNGKGQESLATGIIHTPNHETSCGRTFEPNTRYLITGRVINGQAWVSLCNYVEEWSKMTLEQRKGFKKWYSIGCSCTIRNGPTASLQLLNKRTASKRGQVNSPEPKSCSWDTKFEGDLDCQGLHSICAPISSPPIQSGSLKRRSSLVHGRGGRVVMNNVRRGRGFNARGRSSVRRGAGPVSNPGHNVLNEIETESVQNEPPVMINCHWIPSQTYHGCMRNRTAQADLHHQLLKKYDLSRTVVKPREP